MRNAHRWKWIVLPLLCCMLPACSIIRHDEVMVRIEGNEPNRMAETIADADYELSGHTEGKPIIVHLKAGQPIGFDRQPDHIIAIAGTQRFTLPLGDYHWSMRRD